MKSILRNLGTPILWLASQSRSVRKKERNLGIRISRDWYDPDRQGRVFHTGRSFLMGTFQNELSCRSYWFEGYYEPHPMVCLEALDEFIDVFVDIGANVGIYTLFVSAGGRKKRAFTFDPHPEIHQTLSANIEMNAFDVEIESLALSDQIGEAEMHFPKSETAASLESEFNPNVDYTKKVQISTIDDYFLHSSRLKELPKPGRSFIKIDVLGHESSVLRGAHEFIETCRPNFLLEAVKPFDEAEIDFIRNLGYRFVLMHPDGPIEIDHPKYEVVDGYAYANFVASSDEDVLSVLLSTERPIDFSSINPENTSLSGFMNVK